ncbi:FapA family protein [Peribacillus simplex]|uniref:FapA family protein n=1 Tax=Peribacillus simplex TaxID=1478 RepID=UPI00203AB93D|nr:FapA family protein [Peribacillus simplex]MCM3674176.1 FapA family protein [Peribacillus simplex]
MDHFSVTATKDISILSELDVSNVKEIKSKEGDVFIKGGIFGKGVSKISAARNIFVKHANECHLTAGENIHIGSYSMGSF